MLNELMTANKNTIFNLLYHENSEVNIYAANEQWLKHHHKKMMNIDNDKRCVCVGGVGGMGWDGEGG